MVFSLEYEGERAFQAPDNLPSADTKPELIRERLQKEVKLGCMWGPFKEPLFQHLMCLPVGLVPKKDLDKMRMIMHLSFPYGTSINDFIDLDKASTQYQQFDDAVRLVHRQGQGCHMAKGDVKSAFKLAPIRYKDLECLGIFFEGEFYVDLILPFGSSISCTIFEDISTLIHWIFEEQTRKPFLHYLDYYFMCFRTLQGCWIAYNGMQAVAGDIGLLLSPEKLVPPTQCLTFLGMGIDSVKMIIVVPQDKKCDILQYLRRVLVANKVLAKDLPSLAGKLHFITKAVPQGRAFSARIYWSFKELRPTWHVSVTKEIKKDLQMWIVFLEEYGGSSSIPGLNPPQLEVFSDASANITLLWGAWFGKKWIWGGWDQTFFHVYNPTIDFLKMYTVVVAIYAWSDLMANKHVIAHSSNTPTVAVINDKFAHSPNLMHLVHFLVLHCMLNNITLMAAYIQGSSNKRSDALSCFQLHRFQQLHPEADPHPLPCPSFMYLLSEHTYNNLQL